MGFPGQTVLTSIETRTLRSRDGRSLNLYCWDCPGATAHLVILPGKGDHAGRYGELAARLNGLGWNVWGLDLRGQGRSSGPASQIDRFVEYEWDVEAVLDECVRVPDHGPAVVLGYSLGGTVAVQYALNHPDRVSGLVLVSPCLSFENRLKGLNGLLISLGSWFLPHLVITREYSPTAVTTDPEEQRRMTADPYIDGTTRPRLVDELRRAAKHCLLSAQLLEVPVLTLSSPTDRIVDPSGAEDFHARLGNRGTIRRYPGLRHDLLHEKQRMEVLDHIALWLTTLWGSH